MEVTDLSGAQTRGREAEARVLMDSDLGPLARDAVTDELLHTELIKLADDRHFFYQRVHHLMLDGYSAVLVLQRVAEQYDSYWTARNAGLHRGTNPDSGLRLPRRTPGRRERPCGSAPPTPTGSIGKPSCGMPQPPRDLPAGPRRRQFAGPCRQAAACRGRRSAGSAAGSAPALILTTAALYLHRITGERESPWPCP